MTWYLKVNQNAPRPSEHPPVKTNRGNVVHEQAWYKKMTKHYHSTARPLYHRKLHTILFSTCSTFFYVLYFGLRIERGTERPFLKKNRSTLRTCEHPPVIMGEKISKRLVGSMACTYFMSSVHVQRSPTWVLFHSELPSPINISRAPMLSQCMYVWSSIWQSMDQPVRLPILLVVS